MSCIDRVWGLFGSKPGEDGSESGQVAHSTRKSLMLLWTGLDNNRRKTNSSRTEPGPSGTVGASNHITPNANANTKNTSLSIAFAPRTTSSVISFSLLLLLLLRSVSEPPSRTKQTKNRQRHTPPPSPMASWPQAAQPGYLRPQQVRWRPITTRRQLLLQVAAGATAAGREPGGVVLLLPLIAQG